MLVPYWLPRTGRAWIVAFAVWVILCLPVYLTVGTDAASKQNGALLAILLAAPASLAGVWSERGEWLKPPLMYSPPGTEASDAAPQTTDSLGESLPIIPGLFEVAPDVSVCEYGTPICGLPAVRVMILGAGRLKVPYCPVHANHMLRMAVKAGVGDS